jgi:hypothetical protein
MCRLLRRKVSPGLVRPALRAEAVLTKRHVWILLFSCTNVRGRAPAHHRENPDPYRRGDVMEIRGIGFVGSRTPAHEEMGSFLRDVLGLTPVAVDGVEAAVFAAGNGDVFAVARPDEEDAVAGHDRPPRDDLEARSRPMAA